MSINEYSKGKAGPTVAINQLSYEPRAWRKRGMDYSNIGEITG